MADQSTFDPEQFFSGQSSKPQQAASTASVAPVAPATNSGGSFDPNAFLDAKNPEVAANKNTSSKDNNPGFLSNLWDQTGGGAIKGAQQLLDTKGLGDAWDHLKKGELKEAAKKYGDWVVKGIEEGGPQGRMAKGLLSTSVDQAKKAHDAVKAGNYHQALAHAGAATLPIIAPSANAASDLENGKTDLPSALGTVTGNLGSTLLPAAGDALDSASLSVIPKVADLTPEESAANAYAAQNNIPIPESVRTGNKSVANIESYLANAPGSSGVMKKAANASREALAKTGTDLVEAPGAGSTNYPVEATPETAGEKIIEGQESNNQAIDQSKKEANAAVQKQGEDLVNSVGTTSHTPESAGNTILDTLNKTKESQGSQANAAYNRLREHETNPENIKQVPVGEPEVPAEVKAKLDQIAKFGAGSDSFEALNDADKPKVLDLARKMGIDVEPKPQMKDMAFPVDTSSAVTTLKPILDKLLEEPADVLNRSRALPALKAIVNGPKYVPASVMEDFLSGAKAISREGVNAKTRYLANQAIDAVQPLVDKAVAEGGSDAINALKEGRDLTKAKYATQATIDQLPTEPVQLARKLTAPGDSNINLLRDVKEKTPEAIPSLARATMEGMFEDSQANGSKALAQWNKLGDSTKLELLGDANKVKALDDYFKAADSLQKTDVAPGSKSPVKVDKEPVGAYNKVMRAKDAAINALEETSNVAPDSIPHIVRANLKQLVESATAPEGTRPGPDAGFSQWNKIGDNTKQILYPDPKIRTDISNFMNTAKRIANALDRNTSRTAYVTEAAKAVHMLKDGVLGVKNLASGGMYALTNYGLAKILTTPGGADLLSRGLTLSAKGLSTPAQAASMSSQIFKIAGDSGVRKIEEPAASLKTESKPIENTTSKYKEGDTVKLKNGNTVTIKKINPDGTFEY